MKHALFAILAATTLQGCIGSGTSGNTPDPAVDDPVADTTPVTMSSLESLGAAGAILRSNGEVVTIGGYDYGNSKFTRNGGFAGYFTDGNKAGNLLSAKTDNVEAAAGVFFVGTSNSGVNGTIAGMAGTTVAPPTNGSTTYSGNWGIVQKTNGGFLSRSGDLMLEYGFNDRSVTGTAVTSGGLPQAGVFRVDAQANGNGTIDGTITYDDTINADLDGAFFGDGADEIAGVIEGDNIAGVIVAER